MSSRRSRAGPWVPSIISITSERLVFNMSRWDRLLGVSRSIAIYHAIPGRQRRMRRLYSQFVAPGDLVVDVGAHAGNRVRAFAALGCRVIAIEPQPDFAALLRVLFRRSRRVEVLERAAGETAGRAVLAVSERTPTVTTLAQDWRIARTRDAEFSRVRWNRQLEVETTTLDDVITQFGLPSFIKIDAEGAELAILRGLTRAVRGVSFEYLPRALDLVEEIGRAHV